MSVNDDTRSVPTKPARVLDAKLSDPKVIRSLIRCRPTDPPDQFYANILAVRESGFGFELAEDAELWRVVDEFARDHEHAPQLTTVTDIMRAGGELGLAAADRLESLLSTPPTWGGDFAHLLDLVRELQKRNALTVAIKAAVAIATTGLDVGEGRDKKTLRGFEQAAAYVVEHLGDIASPPLRKGLSGDAMADVDDGDREYQKRKDDPSAAFGQWTGLKQMDESIGGARPSELWIHAAYSGHLKTTFALNWAYNRAIWFHDSVLYFSLEMPYHQVRRWIYAMHSFHPKFAAIRVALGIQTEGGNDVGLDYKSIRDGKLTHAEEVYYRQHVLPDLKDPENGYGRIIIEVADPDKPDVTVDGLRGRAETIYPKIPFSTLYVDHATLVGARSRYTSTTERLTDTLRDLKRFAMRFRRGQGIPVVALYQINREGLKEAHKRKEKGQLPTYDLYNLANASEAERSADVVTASYLDSDYAARNRALFTCLKSRDNQPFAPFLSQIDWPCRRIGTCLESPQADYATQATPKNIIDSLDALCAKAA